MLKLITLPLRILLDALEVVRINRQGARYIAEHPYDPQDREIIYPCAAHVALRPAPDDQLGRFPLTGSALYRKFQAR
jgi:hypothetical protein